MNPARIVIVGAGFGGLTAAKAIRRTPHHVLTANEKEGAQGAYELRQFAIHEVTR